MAGECGAWSGLAIDPLHGKRNAGVFRLPELCHDRLRPLLQKLLLRSGLPIAYPEPRPRSEAPPTMPYGH